MQFDESKYFHPQLKDLFVGYEFFICIPSKSVPTFTPSPITSEPNLIKSEFTVDSYRNLSYDGFKKYSVPKHWIVPYLTGNMIEAEGWNRISAPPFAYGALLALPKLHWFQRDRWIISFADDSRVIGIYVAFPDNDHYGLYLSGICRDINRFRLLVDMIVEQESRYKESDRLLGETNKLLE